MRRMCRRVVLSSTGPAALGCAVQRAQLRGASTAADGYRSVRCPLQAADSPILVLQVRVQGAGGCWCVRGRLENTRTASCTAIRPQGDRATPDTEPGDRKAPVKLHPTQRDRFEAAAARRQAPARTEAVRALAAAAAARHVGPHVTRPHRPGTVQLANPTAGGGGGDACSPHGSGAASSAAPTLGRATGAAPQLRWQPLPRPGSSAAAHAMQQLHRRPPGTAASGGRTLTTGRATPCSPGAAAHLSAAPRAGHALGTPAAPRAATAASSQRGSGGLQVPQWRPPQGRQWRPPTIGCTRDSMERVLPTLADHCDSDEARSVAGIDIVGGAASGGASPRAGSGGGGGGTGGRQAAPMVLNLDCLLDSTSEVLALELAHLSWEQLSQLAGARGAAE